MARADQITIKMNRKTHEWLAQEKRDTGASIRFLMDRAVDLLKKEISRNRNGKLK